MFVFLFKEFEVYGMCLELDLFVCLELRRFITGHISFCGNRKLNYRNIYFICFTVFLYCCLI